MRQVADIRQIKIADLTFIILSFVALRLDDLREKHALVVGVDRLSCRDLHGLVTQDRVGLYMLTDYNARFEDLVDQACECTVDVVASLRRSLERMHPVMPAKVSELFR